MFFALSLRNLEQYNVQRRVLGEGSVSKIVQIIDLAVDFLSDGTSAEKIFNVIVPQTEESLTKFRTVMGSIKQQVNKYAQTTGYMKGFLTEVAKMNPEQMKSLGEQFQTMSKEGTPFNNMSAELVQSLQDINSMWPVISGIVDILGFSSTKIKAVLDNILDENKRGTVTIGEAYGALDLKFDFYLDIIKAVANSLTKDDYTIGEAAKAIFLNETALPGYFAPLRKTLVDDKLSYETIPQLVMALIGFLGDTFAAVFKITLLTLQGFVDPLFRIFDPSTNPAEKIDKIIKILNDYGEQNAQSLAMVFPIVKMLESFKKDGLDIKQFLVQKIPEQTFNNIMEIIMDLFDESTSLWDTVLNAGINFGITNLTSPMYIIGNFTNNLADASIPFKKTLDMIDAEYPNIKILEFYQMICLVMKDLADPNTAIYDLSVLPESLKEQAKGIVATVIQFAGLLTSKYISFNDLVGEKAAIVTTIKTILTSEITLVEILKQFTGEDIKISKLAPAFQNIVDLTNKLPEDKKISMKPIIDALTKIASYLKQSGDKMTLKQLFDSLSLTEIVSKIVSFLSLCVENKDLYTIVSSIPDIFIKFGPTLEKLSKVTIPSLTNIGNSLVFATVSTSKYLRLAKEESTNNAITTIVKVFKSFSENPDKVSVGDICKDVGVETSDVVETMKLINDSVKSTSVSTIVNITTGKDITTFGKSVKNIASKAKEGKITVDDCANAAKAVDDAVNPKGGDGSEKGDDVTNKSNKQLYIIIGCVIGAIAVVALIVGFIVFVRRNHSESSYKELQV